MEREKVTKSVPSGAERDKGTFPFRNGFLCLLSLLLPHLVCMSQRFFDNERGKKWRKGSEGLGRSKFGGGECKEIPHPVFIAVWVRLLFYVGLTYLTGLVLWIRDELKGSQTWNDSNQKRANYFLRAFNRRCKSLRSLDHPAFSQRLSDVA